MARITLAMGGEPVLIDRAVDRAVAQARGEVGPAVRVSVNASDPDAGTAIREAMAPTLFGDATILIVKGIDDASESVDAALRAYVQEPVDTCYVIATHPGGVKGKALVEVIRAAGAQVVDCPVLKRGRATADFLQAQLREQRRSITADALEIIMNAIGQDVRLLVAAVEQCMRDIEHDPITADDVRVAFAGVAEVSGYAIADAVWERRSADALRSLRWSMAGGEQVGVPTVMALASGLRSIVRVAAVGPGASEVDAAKEAGVPPWKVKVLRRQWSAWSGDQRRLAQAVVSLAEADGAVKGGVGEGNSLDNQQKLLALESLVLRTAARRSGS
ncbi:MAG: DNA polymerase III subunit delta [Actinomycetales bacterium]